MEPAARRNRRSVRLPAFGYAGNATYFLTICTFERAHLFGEVIDQAMHLNQFGRIAAEEIMASSEIRAELDLHHAVVMPNHVHLLLTMTPTETPISADIVARQRVRPPKSLGSFVAGFKSGATRRINEARGLEKAPVWQRNYHEHIVRNEQAFLKIWDYIEHNPTTWADDIEYT